MTDSSAPRRSGRGHRRGDGSIYPDARGGYRAVVTVPDPVSGRPVRRYFRATTEAGARKLAAEALRARDRGDVVGPSPTLEAWARRWLLATASRVRPRTLNGYRVALEVHAVPRLGRIEVAKLRPSDVELLLASLVNGGMAPSTAGIVRTVLGACLESAVRDGLATRNAAREARPPRATVAERRALTPDELRRILAAAAEDDALGPAVELLAATGLRRGEVLGLKWEDVDTATRTLAVRRALVPVRGGAELGELKSTRSRRTIALPRLGLTALDRRRRLQDRDREAAGRDWANREGLIFTTRLGTHYQPNDLYTAVVRAAGRAGVANVSPHTFRHTVASAILAAGVPPRDAAEALGHSPAVLMRTYAHAMPGSRERVAAALERTLTEAEG